MVDKIGYIYKITNTVNGKVYIGFSTNPEYRFEQHKKESTKKFPKSIFHKAIKKYTWNNFKKEVIYGSKDHKYCLEEMEQYFISEYNSYENGYNMTLGGGGSFIGRKHTSETILKMREMVKYRPKISEETRGKQRNAKLGTKHSEETRQKRSKALKGRVISQETLDKKSKSMMGKTHSEETKRKISLANKGRKVSPDEIAKKVLAISKNYLFVNPLGKKIKIKNLKNFCRKNNLDLSSMYRINSGERKSHRGYKKGLEV